MKNILLTLAFIATTILVRGQTSIEFTNRLRLNPNAITLTNNGEFNYLLSTHKIKVRINGATENMAVESWVAANFLSSSGGSFWKLSGRSRLTSDVVIYPNVSELRNIIIGANLDQDTVSAQAGFVSNFVSNKALISGTDEVSFLNMQPQDFSFSSAHPDGTGSKFIGTNSGGSAYLSMSATNSSSQETFFRVLMNRGLMSSTFPSFSGIEYDHSPTFYFSGLSLVHKDYVDSLVAGSGSSNPFADNTALVKNDVDNTKLAIFSASGISTATTRTYTLPNVNGTMALTSDITNPSIGGTITSGTTGSMLFVGAGSVFAQDNTNLFFDNTNKQVGIGTNAPTTGVRLEVKGIGTGSNDILRLSNSASIAKYRFSESGITTFNPTAVTTTTTATLTHSGSFNPSSGTATYTNYSMTPTYNTTGTYVGTGIGFDFNPALTSVTGLTNIAYRATSGSSLFGGTALSSTTNRFEIKGLGSTSSTVSLNVRNSSDSRCFAVDDIGRVFIGTTANVAIIRANNVLGSVSTSASNVWFANDATLTADADALFTFGRNTVLGSNVTGTQAAVRSSVNYSPNSGATSFSSFRSQPIWNQTGTASGDIIGYLHDPTNTAILGTHYAFKATSGQSLFNGTTVTANTTVDVRGVSSGSILRLANNSNTEVFDFLNTGELQLSGSSGTAGQALISGGSGSALTWGTFLSDASQFWKTSGTTTITASVDVLPSSAHLLNFGGASNRFNDVGVYTNGSFFIDGLNGSNSVSTFFNSVSGSIDLSATNSGITSSLTINNGSNNIGFSRKIETSIASGFAPINIAGQSSDPSTLVNNDIFVNTTGSDLLKVRLSSTTETILTTATLAATQIVYGSGTQIRAKGESAFTYDESTNTVGVDAINGATAGLSLTTGSNGNVSVTPNGVGDFNVSTGDEINLTSADEIDISTGGAGVPRLRIEDNGSWELAGNTGTAGQVLTTNGGSSAPTWGLVLSVGRYTPTVTGITNVDSNTPVVCSYQRIGDQVTVFGSVAVDATAASGTTIHISLPIASNITAVSDLAGTMGHSGSNSGKCSGDATTDTASLDFVSPSTASELWRFSFNYIVQ